MNKQRIIFRADGSKTIGYGHFIRSLALAGYLKDEFDCHFASFNSTEPHLTEFQHNEVNNVCKYHPIEGDSIVEFNYNFLLSLRPEDIVVLDNYYFTTEYQQSIKDIGCKLVCIEDMHDRHMVCDLILTSCPLKKSDFSCEKYTLFRGGLEWAFLREPFLQPNISRKPLSVINSVVIAMGGADPFRLTDMIATCVHSILPNASIHIIAGNSTIISDRIYEIAEVHRNISAQQITELFDKSDFGIFPASTICIEALSRHLPMAAGYYVDNQEEFYYHNVEKGLFIPLGCLLDDETTIYQKIKSALGNLKKPTYEIDFKRGKDEIIKLFKQLSN